MKVEYKKSFDDDLKYLDKNILDKLFSIIFTLKDSSSIKEISNIKKLRGYKNIYRIKIGNYRLGFTFENNLIVLERFLHRKDIYKRFPK
ncbi:type II toxin-antitoxin system RelE/ParE family toxin [Candidatus Gracilibacteria bacterium]|nr:type II toxin-antitoxin system RelE/ParE family toxin [Candidatus Gracilibacteria bacterium]